MREGNEVIINEESNEKREKYIKIMEDYHSGNDFLKQQAINEMVETLSKYVYSIIRKMFSSYLPKYLDDLYQEGIVGILKNIGKYDPTKSMPTTFFNIYIIGEMNTFIINNVNKTTNYYGHNIIKINKAIKEFEMSNQDYTDADIAEKLKIPIETVINCREIIKNSKDSEYEMSEMLDNSTSPQIKSPEDLMLEKEKEKILLDALNSLDVDEKYIIAGKLGLVNKPKAYKTLASELGISIDKVKKKYKLGLRKVKKIITTKNYFGNTFLSEEEKYLEEVDISFIETLQAEEALIELENIELDLGDVF